MLLHALHGEKEVNVSYNFLTLSCIMLLFTPQDFKSMFGHFTLCMEGLTITST